MAVASALYRVLELALLALQHRIANSKWKNSIKFITTEFVTIASYYIFDALGWALRKLLLAAVMRFASSYVIPIVYFNFCRVLKLVLNYKIFNVANFALRNVMFSINNLATTAFFEASKYCLNSNLHKSKNESTSLKVCCYKHKFQGTAVITEAVSSDIKNLRYVVDELG